MLYANGTNDCVAPVLQKHSLTRGKVLSRTAVFTGGVIERIREIVKAEGVRLESLVLDKKALRPGDVCLFSFRKSGIPHHFAIFQGGENVYHILPGGSAEASWIDWRCFCFGLRGKKWV
jgi:cell wall-associated NlpC family hydrolase